MPGVLAGYRVLDLADEKGMLCTKLLADMGADVISIQRPGAAESGPDYLDAGKRRINLSLEKEAGRGLFRRLVAKADVLVETSPPGYMTAKGLGYDELSQINSGLIMVSLTDFGQDGPYRDYKSCDLVAAALGGWLSVSGEPAAPLKPFGNQAYYTASLFAANGVMLALWQRHATGRGQHLDISVMECVAATLDHVLVRYFSEGVVATRQGNLHWNRAFKILPCRDGYILLSLFQHWETLLQWLASEDMAADLADAKWQSREARLAGIDHIIEVLEKWTMSHTVAELVQKGQLMRFPWAEVASVDSLLKSPQLAARGYFAEVEMASRRYMVPGAPVRMGGSPWRAGGVVAAMGEDNRAIYHGEMGLSLEEMVALEKEGVI